MNDDEKEKILAMINGWKEVDKVMAKLRREEIRKSVISESIAVFDNAFRSAIYLNKPKPTSGFVEFYKVLGKTK
jgi:hypothetical protein